MCINLAKWHSKQLLTWSSSCNLSRAIVVENKTSKKSADINPQNEKRRSPRRQYAILLSFDTSLGPVLLPQHFRTNLPISTRVCVCHSLCPIRHRSLRLAASHVMFIIRKLCSAPLCFHQPTPGAPVAMPFGTFNLATS